MAEQLPARQYAAARWNEKAILVDFGDRKVLSFTWMNTSYSVNRNYDPAAITAEARGIDTWTQILAMKNREEILDFVERESHNSCEVAIKIDGAVLEPHGYCDRARCEELWDYIEQTPVEKILQNECEKVMPNDDFAKLVKSFGTIIDTYNTMFDDED